MSPLKQFKEDLEWQIQQRIIKELRYRLWFVKETHGSMYQSGFPDLFCCHKRYGHRWLEVKRPVGWKFTPAQLETFPMLCAAGSHVWIANTEVEVEALLMSSSNWHHYLLGVK